MPIRHRMKLTPENFERVRTGQQQFEFRLFDEKRQALQVGERIEFAKLPALEQSLIVEIVSIQTFPSLELAISSTFPNVAVGENTDRLSALRQIYSESEEKKYGVVVLGIKLV